MNNLPSFKDILSISRPVEIKISPDGDKVAYVLESPNWKENRYESYCYIYFVDNDQSFKLTNTSCECSNLRWVSNDSLALLKKNLTIKKSQKQIYLYEHLIGDGLRITDSEHDIQHFEFFSNGFIYTTEDKTKASTTVTDNFGDIVHVEEEQSKDALFYTNVTVVQSTIERHRNKISSNKKKLKVPVLNLSKLLPSRFKIENLFASDESNRIFITCRLRDDMIYLGNTKNFVIEGDIIGTIERIVEDVNNEDSTPLPEHSDNVDYSLLTCKEISLPSGSHIVEINKNGQEILIDYHKDGENLFYTQKDIWKLSLIDLKLDDKEAIKSHLVNLTDAIDQELIKVKWLSSSIYFFYYDHCDGEVSEYNLKDQKLEKIHFNKELQLSDFDVSLNTFCFIGTTLNSLPNIYLFQNKSSSWVSRKITNIDTVGSELIGNTEQVSWQSRDGTIIEGILRKPKNFDSNKKYPLVLIVHGGPTFLSKRTPFDSSDMFYYPTLHFINNDILVLKPNYRGSLGRGADFMKLNKDNLGIGDLWDIESGVEFLINEGFVDDKRVGCMGWSQGGYISAFATVNSSMFKAISVGAGISDWYTYYISTDIRQFTRHYLSGNPYENLDNYLKTAPMTNIKNAKTPTLIQHGSSDQRVPYSNATELFRSLKDLGVTVEFFSYTNFPHGIHKPKENRAIVTQNFAWFTHYLQEKELNFFETNSL